MIVAAQGTRAKAFSPKDFTTESRRHGGHRASECYFGTTRITDGSSKYSFALCDICLGMGGPARVTSTPPDFHPLWAKRSVMNGSWEVYPRIRPVGFNARPIQFLLKRFKFLLPRRQLLRVVCGGLSLPLIQNVDTRLISHRQSAPREAPPQSVVPRVAPRGSAARVASARNFLSVSLESTTVK